MAAITSRTSTLTSSRLKDWLRRFKGVATHYLPSYLGWRRMIESGREDLTATQCLFQALHHAAT